MRPYLPRGLLLATTELTHITVAMHVAWVADMVTRHV